jgi:S1-C subfamily serine protease
MDDPQGNPGTEPTAAPDSPGLPESPGSPVAPAGPGPEPALSDAAAEQDAAAAALLVESLALDDAFTEAVTAAPARVAPTRPALELPAPPANPPAPAAPPPPPGRLIPAFFWPATFLLLVILAAVFVYPTLLARWRLVEGAAEAEVAYQKRRAELKAEAEAATQMLDVLDKRINLVSLGFREVVRKVTPNVVNVTNFRELGSKKGGEAKGRAPLYLDPETERHYRQVGVGSGIIVRPGQILTNYHVIRGADRLRVTFSSGQSAGVDVANNVVADAVTDLAVIRLPADLPCGLAEDLNVTTEFADSDRDVHRGDLVLALGSPLGLKQTVTHGIISAKGRLLDRITLVELLQTDAAINPGNSGGPLFDQYGRLAGINVAIASDNGGNQGIGFAIPSNTAKKVFEQLAEHGVVVRGYIGVALGDLTPAQAEAAGLRRSSGGVLVAQVVPGQAAANAGMQAGDVIVRYNNEPLGAFSPMRQLRAWILETEVGRVVPVDVFRDGRRKTLSLRIGKRPPDLP